MMLPFLEYINDAKSFGVPYTTHIWQVNDANRLNGAFKIELIKAKRKYIKHRDVPRFEPTDVPLTNMAFPKSFGNVIDAKKLLKHGDGIPLIIICLLWFQEITQMLLT
jgi:hypothetical protein